MKWFVRVMQEPLLHFLLLGIVLFAVSHYWGNSADTERDDALVVSERKILNLAHMWQRTWQRPPTQQELDGLIDDYVNEEVLYREALAMGLDQDDTIIRRRLRQKLEFVAEDLADAVEPTDEQLQQYLKDHPDSFRMEPRVTFTQVFFSPQRRGETLDQDVAEALTKLRESEDANAIAEFGDSILLPHHHDNLRASKATQLFGPQFGSELLAVEAGQWAGPIPSGYGVHLVFVHRRMEGRLPALDEVRDAVRREWYADRRALSKQEFYRKLRDRYEVTIEMPRFEDANQADTANESGTEAESEAL